MIQDSKCLIAVPTRGTINWNTVRRLMELQEKHPTALFHLEAGNLGVSHVRNAIVQKFLETDCESLLQIDDDVIPDINVLEMAKSVTEKEPVIAAPYHIVRAEVPTPFPCVFRLRDPQDIDGESIASFTPIVNPWRQGQTECDGVGTGSMAVHRSLLERKEMAAPFAMEFRKDGTMRTSDDLAFCARVRRLGFPIFADYRYFADHMVELSMQLVEHGYAKAYTLAKRKEQSKPLVSLA